jgi:hypothetical protein
MLHELGHLPGHNHIQQPSECLLLARRRHGVMSDMSPLLRAERTSRRRMFLARNEVISNPCHWHDFRPSPRTLWELTQIRPKHRLLELIANGKINSSMTREEAIALRHGKSQGRSPAPTLKREIAALLEVCIILGGGDGVLAHIRDLKDVGNIPPAKEFDRAARWVRQKLAERRQSE